MTIEELESVIKIAERHNFRSIYMQGIKDALNTIIHCKDCKWWDKKRGCELLDFVQSNMENFYCANAEKMDEVDDGFNR